MIINVDGYIYDYDLTDVKFMEFRGDKETAGSVHFFDENGEKIEPERVRLALQASLPIPAWPLRLPREIAGRI